MIVQKRGGFGFIIMSWDGCKGMLTYKIQYRKKNNKIISYYSCLTRLARKNKINSTMVYSTLCYSKLFSVLFV